MQKQTHAPIHAHTHTHTKPHANSRPSITWSARRYPLPHPLIWFRVNMDGAVAPKGSMTYDSTQGNFLWVSVLPFIHPFLPSTHGPGSPVQASQGLPQTLKGLPGPHSGFPQPGSGLSRPGSGLSGSSLGLPGPIMGVSGPGLGFSGPRKPEQAPGGPSQALGVLKQDL